MKTVRILCIGDLIGKTGVNLFNKHIATLKKQYAADLIVVNGENSAPNGRGITSAIAEDLFEHGANVITGGNHSFDQKEVYEYLADLEKPIIRPANYPTGCPGKGFFIVRLASGKKLGVVNLQGRVFSRQLLECPFKMLETMLTFLKSQTNLIIVDFHAEATSEKAGFAYSFDGKVSSIFGTHTHIQTSDERILPGGTAFITDIGMAGSLNSMIGMKKEPIIHNLRTQLPVKFEVDSQSPFVLSGILIELDQESGQAVSIERVFRVYQE